VDYYLLPRFREFQVKIAHAMQDWHVAFGVDLKEIERQVRIAHAWCDNNPRRAPKKDIPRFLNNWMQIADRKGSLKKMSAPIAPRAPEVETDMSYEEMVEIRKRNMSKKGELL
jgi:hypothetical protein